MSSRYGRTIIVFWVLAFATVPIWCALEPPPPGWDLHVYANAIRSLHAGHDPYADGIAVQRAVHEQGPLPPGVAPPYTYVYSPLTLPLLRVLSPVPLGVLAAAYWVVYVAGLLAAIWVGVRLAQPEEAPLLKLWAPAAAFFPGLLQANVMLSGNLAYILYGLVFVSALIGWRRGDWRWFYLATVATSCFKAPMLTLLAVPVLTARKQWLPASIAAGVGALLFAVQPSLWPSAFHNYLDAVALQFSYNHDFGFSPAGLLGNVLFYYGLPYSAASTLCYAVYALLVLGTLFYLAQRYFAGCFSLERWAPVVLIGVVLLNPRIKEYDVAPLTLPMAVVLWRLMVRWQVVSHDNSLRRSAVNMSLCFLAINWAATFAWKPTEGVLLVALFVAGSWDLLQEPRDIVGESESTLQTDQVEFGGAVSA
jgi:hypothetical protein